MDENRIKDLLPFYALDILSDVEKAEVEAYLAASPEAQAELIALRKAISALPYSTTSAKPASRVKKELLARIQADPRARAALSAAKPPSRLAKFLGRLHWGSNLNLMMPTIAALSLFLAVISGALAMSLQREVDSLNQRLNNINNDVARQLAPLQRQLNPLREENIDLKATLTAQDENFAALGLEISALEEKNDRMQQKLLVQTEQLNQLNQRVANVSANSISTADWGVLRADVSAQANQLTALKDETLASLQGEIAQLQAANTQIKQELLVQRAAMAQLTTPDVQIMLIAGTDTLPKAHGHFVADPNNESGFLVVAGLPKLQPKMEYHFWLVQNGLPVRVGALDVDETGLGILIFSVDRQIGTFNGMGVSIEPAGSNGKPTNEMVMLGQLSS